MRYHFTINSESIYLSFIRHLYQSNGIGGSYKITGAECDAGLEKKGGIRLNHKRERGNKATNELFL